MIRKHFILLVFIALEALPSCKTTNFVGRVIQSKKAHENSQIDYYFERGDSVPFDFRSGKILFEAEINGQKDTVMFDTGCTTSILEMVSETDCPDIKFFEASVRTFGRSKLKMAIEPVRYSFGYMDIKSTRSFVLMKDISLCDEELSIKDMYPIVGTSDLFFKRIKLDFTNGWMRIVTQLRDTIDTIDLTGYQEVKCKKMFPLNALKIYLTIDGKERECLFDTGNQTGFIILKDKKRVMENFTEDIHYEGAFAKSISGLTDSQNFCAKLGESVVIDDYQCEDNVMYVSEMDMDNVGIGFISRFDWVLDPYHQKVYFKPRNIGLEQRNIYPYSLTTINGELKIKTRCLSMNPKFNVGDVIKSVDGEEITKENICHYYELLKEAKDWSAFDIQVK